MENYNIILSYLGEDGLGESNLKYTSCLKAAIREARTITGRNIENGNWVVFDDNNKVPCIWAGAMIYMTILYQIGTAIKLKKFDIRSENRSIVRALRQFTKLNELEIDAIYALRNAFFHDFSLINVHSKKSHCFLVDDHPLNEIIILTDNPWNGSITNTSPTSNQSTYVNLRALGNLVEDIYSNLFQLLEFDELEIALPKKDLEMFRRYFFVITV